MDGWYVICWARARSCGTGAGGGGTGAVVSSVGIAGCTESGVLYCRSKPALSRSPASILFFMSVIFLMVTSLRANVRPRTSVRNGSGMGSKVLRCPARLQYTRLAACLVFSRAVTGA